MKKVAICLTVAILTLIGAFVSCKDTSAWMGTDGTGSGHSAAAGGGGGGSSVDQTGTSWMYYEYIGGSRFRGWSIEFVPTNRDFGGITRTIDPECAQDGMGFWHFGRNQFATFYHDFYDAFWKFNDFESVLLCKADACWNHNRYSTRKGGWGHMQTYIWKEQFRGTWNYPYNANINQADIDHYIYSWDNNEKAYFPIYRAIKVSPADGEVWDAYKYEAERQNQQVAPRGTYPDNLYAFCSPNGPVSNGLKVDLVYHDKTIEEDACTHEQNVKDNSWTESKTYNDKDDGEDGWVKNIDTLRDERVADGWHLDSQDPNGNGNGITWHDSDLVDAEVSEPRTVTIHLSRETKNTVNQDEDCECRKWSPDEYKNSNAKEGWSTVRIGVINGSLPQDSEYAKWHHDGEPTNGLMQGIIYAKPTDEIQWRYCYYPGVERAAYTKVTLNKDHGPDSGDTYHFNNVEIHNDGKWPGSYRAWTTNLKPSGENEEWSEDSEVGNYKIKAGTLPGGPLNSGETGALEGIFKVAGRIYGVQPREQQSFDNGGSTWSAKESYFGERLDPGTELRGDIETKGNTHAKIEEPQHHEWGCHWDTHCSKNGCYSHWHDTCTHTDDFVDYNIETTRKSDSARVYVPYSYLNYGDIKIIDDSKDILYAGETVKVHTPTITVGTRKNETLDGEYATQVPNGRARVIAFITTKDKATSNNFWNGAEMDSDGYGNDAPNGGKIVASSAAEACDAIDAKNGVCKNLESGDAMFNEISDTQGVSFNMANQSQMDGHNKDKKLSTDEEYVYNVFDEAAGNYFCVSAAIWPFSVTKDLEDNPNGDQMWYYSMPDCRPIGKRPTFQVWGAGVYSAGDITTRNSIKNNVLSDTAKWDTSNLGQMGGDFEPWTPKNTSLKILFGSWVELTATLQGTTDTFSSGAGIAYRQDGGYSGIKVGPSSYSNGGEAKSPWEISSASDKGYPLASMGYGGGFEGDAVGTLCKRNSLSLANVDCDSSVGNFYNPDANPTMRNNLEAEKQYLLKRFTPEGSNGSGLDGGYLYEEEGSFHTTVQKGQTIVQHFSGALNIDQNIELEASARNDLSTLQDVAKYFIYADGGITIDCTVTRIDAVLITNGTVKTCGDTYGAEGIDTQAAIDANSNNNPDRSKQLMINGAVVSGSMVMSRSFGMSTGERSMTPAELINYDTSIYLWANRAAEGVTSGSITEKTSRELAPRY